MSQNTDEKIRELTARFEREAKDAEQRAIQARKAQSEAADAYDRRLAERQEQEAKDDQARAQQELSRQTQQLRAMSASEEWTRHIDARIKAYFDQWFVPCFTHQCEPLYDEIGEALGKTRGKINKDIDAAVADVQQWVNGTLETKIAPKFEVLEHRLAQYTKNTDALGGAITTERAGRENEIRTAIKDVKHWAEDEVRTKLETLEQRLDVVAQAEQQADKQRWAAIDQRIQRLEKELDGRLGPGALHETQSTVESKLEAKLESKLEASERHREAAAQGEQQANKQRWDAIDQRIGRLEQELDGRLGPGALHEAERATETKLESKLTALEERLKSVPGKLPVAKTWRPETVVYQSEFVSYEGATWQATKDTAQAPGGSDAWVCVARAGRDAITPTVRDTYDAREKYHQLDIVAMDGGSFIARKDNPGVCPGDGWRLLAKQGRVGRPGAPGERGPRGERGEKGPAVMPKLVNSKIDENYNLVVLREDESLEILPLRDGFARYNAETSE